MKEEMWTWTKAKQFWMQTSKFFRHVENVLSSLSIIAVLISFHLSHAHWWYDLMCETIDMSMPFKFMCLFIECNDWSTHSWLDFWVAKLESANMMKKCIIIIRFNFKVIIRSGISIDTVWIIIKNGCKSIAYAAITKKQAMTI